MAAAAVFFSTLACGAVAETLATATPAATATPTPPNTPTPTPDYCLDPETWIYNDKLALVMEGWIAVDREAGAMYQRGAAPEEYQALAAETRQILQDQRALEPTPIQLEYDRTVEAFLKDYARAVDALAEGDIVTFQAYITKAFETDLPAAQKEEANLNAFCGWVIPDENG